ncbi:MAG TPA: helix-turn-helix domain-containing protein [Methanospirillum sp.]|uniref:helix-turn-helix domain-containing protein n=1 Tax=Methanospirillum sp. TaxID=45200 RepID=UPI002C1E7896|nr:helix-turn-helix domain-containing protein [Methanospirillum sp.]HWQ64677.1 helix-turn-helix domain-containing protein [Methanospirillum sp.]
MQDGPVVIREDVTVSLDKDLINDLLGIAESREMTLSVLVRDVLGSFCRAFHAGSDWTTTSSVGSSLLPDLVQLTDAAGEGSVSQLESRVAAHDLLFADLQRRLSALEYNAGISRIAPQYVTPESGALQATLSPASNSLAAVIDCDTPLAGSVSDDALVKMRKPIPPVMTSIDTNSIGRINPEQVYSQTEAAALLHLSITTIRKYVKEQRIGFQKIGRSTLFRGQDLLNYLAQSG